MSDNAKKNAADKALELVEDDMIVGLGTGVDGQALRFRSGASH